MLKGSVASSPREKRNARKRSFEQSMSATAAKILKMEQEREKTTGEKVSIERNTMCSYSELVVYINSTAFTFGPGYGLHATCMWSLCYVYMCVMQE